VECVAVDLDDEPLVAPEEVDLPSPDPDVHLGLWQVGRSDQLEEPSLGVRSRQLRLRLDRLPQGRGSSVVGVALELLIEGEVCYEVVDAGFVGGSAQVLGAELGGQVEEGAGR